MKSQDTAQPTRSPARIDFMGCIIDNLSMEETLDRIDSFIRSRKPHQHVVVNVDKIIKAQRSPELRRIINSCALINVDGMPVVWASRILGTPLKERVAGIDLFEALVERSARRGWRVYFLGASESVVRRVVEIYAGMYPELQIAGFRNGYWDAFEERKIARQIADSNADILFVAISSPTKEEFLNTYQSEMSVPFAMGVGGSFDVIAGKVKRAPIWMQRSGLEWFYRFMQEPRRMFRRYFIDDMAFIRLVVKEIFRK
jgi:N-acetylglucosaminyldiphosphoundecaprenol N-acetyl-beta-D-mannosaminyltransferase